MDYLYQRIAQEKPGRTAFQKTKGGENLAAFTSRGGVLVEKTQFAFQLNLCKFHSADELGGFAASASRRL